MLALLMHISPNVETNISNNHVFISAVAFVEIKASTFSLKVLNTQSKVSKFFGAVTLKEILIK